MTIDSVDNTIDLPLLTEAERQQLLVDWNATTCAYPRQQCVHQLFEAQVERTPEAVALIFEEQQLTYRQLNERANQLAHYLQRLSVGPEVRVGLCIERSPEMVIGLLGILKAGGAYVPLDPVYPQERLAFMLEDAQTTVLVTRQGLVERLPQHKQVVCLDTEWNVIAQESKENTVNVMTSENLVYMLYTSGSTGKPKGVLGTHRAAINRFSWMWNTYPFEPDEVCCQKTALSFVDSVWEIFGPLLQGIRTVIIPDMIVKSPELLLQMLAAHAVTRIVLVPSLLRILLDLTADLQNQLPTLKYWISSGETLPLDLALRFVDKMPNCVLLNLYGSSEVAADATFYDMREGKALTSVPIGRPIANTQIYLLDHHNQLVPIGTPGELHVGGDGLARGYFNRPDLTAAKFVPCPFSTIPGTLLYKTGDWARYLPDGNIEYLGRIDHQVKIRGFRIELGEVEAVLNAHPAVQQAVVVAREDVPGDKRLVAYVVLQRQQSVTISELQEQLTKTLPTYMVPSAFMFLETFPLLPNGKVDRHALPAPDQARPELQQTFVAPRTPMEERIASIWSSILGIERVGIHDNFFALGGHSLLAMQVISQIQNTLRITLPLRSFFDAPTVAEQAELLALSHVSDDLSNKPSIRPIPRAAQRGARARENSTS
nr:amino acid adenylation domain-containing protein [Ktedonobacteraceae bacterium]